MTNSRGALSLATAVLLLVAGTSCAEDDADPTDPRSTPTASSPSSESPTPTSPSEAATAHATETIRDYYAVRNQLRQDPTQPLSLLKSVAISTELTTQQTLFKRERQQGLHQTGETKVVELQVQSAAKKADADFRISLARRSSATSFFSSRISAMSSLVFPGR